MNLGQIWAAGLSGLLLGLAVVVGTGIFLILADRLTGGNGTAGMAAASTAGNSAAVPALVAAADHRFDASDRPAAVLIASSVIVTTFLTPPLTAWWYRMMLRKAPMAHEAESK